MPICLEVTEVEVGMQLYQPVCNEHVVLLAAGKVLDHVDVRSLKQRFHDCKILVCDPFLDAFCDVDEEQRDMEVAREVRQRIGQSLGPLSKKLAGRTAMRSGDVHRLQNLSKGLLEHLERNPVDAVLLDRMQRGQGYLELHSANVFYTAMVLGMAVRDYIIEERRRLTHGRCLKRSFVIDLTPLAVGCLLHDIGMYRHQDILEQSDALTPEQRRRIREHPNDGLNMLPPSASALTRMVVSTHHEAFNGQGYPRGLTGDKLHVFSRIIRVADAFDGATADKAYSQAKSEARVLWEMTAGPMRDFYDPVITKVFLDLIRPFPIGAKLKLSNGMIGVVVKQSNREPFRPEVIVAFDADGRRLPEHLLRPPIALEAHRDLRVVACGDEDLTYLATCTPVYSDDTARDNAFDYAYP